MVINKSQKNLRLLFPQWQAGINRPYVLGAHLLNFLAPKEKGVFEQVSLDESNLDYQAGIYAKQAILNQTKEAKKLIQKHNPDSLVVLGGDCSVDLAPFAFLNEKYNGDTVLLWVDAHPDVSYDMKNHHSQVLANLLGVGDRDFVKEVNKPLRPEQVLYVGLSDMLDALELKEIKGMNLQSLSSEELDESKVLAWLKERQPTHVMIHFDLDVLDMTEFRSILPANPNKYEEYKEKIPRGTSMENIINVLQEVGRNYNVVGLGITEHFPWDALYLKNMLERLPLIGDVTNTERLKFNDPLE
ncbi:arginase family protein [Bacillus sp. JCM 19041]|uniref:arginase family protein n=1 Tax=Bacillus sp. JCM 19041 TaxID=1460637 RepID=UPI0006CF5607